MLACPDYCEDAIRNGLDLFPVQDDKRPYYGFKWADAYTTEQRLEFIQKDVWGTAIPCNEDLLCIDFDSDADALFPDFLLKIWNDRPALAYRFWAEKTPHGYHMIFQVRGKAPGNTKLAARSGDPQKWSEKHGRFERADEVIVQIETRGKGGYFVTFPSPGYEWVSIPVKGNPDMSATEIWNLEPISEDDIEWLFSAARAFSTYEGPKREKKRSVPEVSPERKAERNRKLARERKSGWTISDPIEYWGTGCSQERYEEILKDYDWQKGKTDENGRIWYWRPGLPQDPKNYSGNLYKKEDCWLLYIFTTNSELPADSGLAAWQFLMYQEGFTDAKYPELIQPDEIREWMNTWYNDMAERTEVFWKPTADHLNVLQDQFNWR